MFDWLVDLFTKPANNYGSNNGGSGRQNNNYNYNKTSTTTNKTTSNSTTTNKINTMVSLNGKEYPVYKSATGAYYIVKDGKQYDIQNNANLFRQLNSNKKISLNITNRDIKEAGTFSSNTGSSSSSSSSSSSTSKPSTNTTTSSGSSSTTSSAPVTSSGGSNVDYYEDRIARLENENKEFKNTINELLKEPEVMSAAEAAKHFNINNNLEDILNDYNTRTKEFYDGMINTQNDLRTSYARNNTQYYDNLLDSYMESYKYAAPTSVGKGTLAANALTNQLNAGNAIAANDYGMMQSVENLKEAKLAELANNPLLAEQYKNDVNTFLSTLTANNHAADVKQRVAELDAYSDMYASSREEQASLANAASTKYAGLANANTYNNSSSGSQVSNFENLYNYFLDRYNGDSTKASKHVNNLLSTSSGQTQI